MPSTNLIWDLPDDPEGNVQHIAEHGLTPLDVEYVLNHSDRRETSRSSGRPIVFGHTPRGEYIAVVYEEIRKLQIEACTQSPPMKSKGDNHA